MARSGADDGRFSRRRLIATGAATWTTISVAGCSDGGDPTATETESLTVTNKTTTTEDPGTPGDDTEEPGGTPTETASPTGTACTSAGRFAAGQEIGLLVGVYRTESGEKLGPGEVDSVHASFASDGIDDRELDWEGGHERVVDDRWGTRLSDTDELEPGAHSYEVTVTTTAGEEATVADKFAIVGV